MYLGKGNTGILKLRTGLWQCGVMTATTLHLKEGNLSFNFLHSSFWFPFDIQQKAIDICLGKEHTGNWNLKRTAWGFWHCCVMTAFKGVKSVFWLPPQYLVISVWHATKYYWSFGKEAENKTSSSSHGNCYVGVSRSQHSAPSHTNTYRYNYTCTQPLHDKRQCAKLLRELRA